MKCVFLFIIGYIAGGLLGLVILKFFKEPILKFFDKTIGRFF